MATPLLNHRFWSYEFDSAEGAAANGTAQVVGGRSTTDAYDDQHRLIATDDPVLAGEVAYDSRGNTTRLVPLTLTSISVAQLVSGTDGDTTVEMLLGGLAVAGQRIASVAPVRVGRWPPGGATHRPILFAGVWVATQSLSETHCRGRANGLGRPQRIRRPGRALRGRR